MKYLRLFWKIFKKIILSILIFLSVYFGFALVLSLLTVTENPEFSDSKNFEMYISSNGIHSEFTVPFQSEIFDWGQFIDVNDFDLKGKRPQFVSFGWGEEKFLLETPTWGDLTVYNFFHALFWNSSALIQTRIWTGIPMEGKNIKKIEVSPVQYQLLIAYVLDTFSKDEKGKLKLIPEPGYGPKDRFYRAEGQYNLIQTCNSWVNDGLKEIGVKTAVWSPWDFGIFYHLD